VNNPIAFGDADDGCAAVGVTDYDEFREVLDNINNKVTILHMNIRSIQKNFHDFLILLNTLSTSNISIIILTETWKIGNKESFSINGYASFYNNSTFNQNDGIIVFVKHELNPQFNIKTFNETLPIEINLNINKILFRIYAIYRSPSSNQQQFIHDLYNKILTKQKDSSVDIILGDMNLNLLKQNCPIVSEYINTFLSTGFKSHINIPTRVTNTSTSCIDHCLVKLVNINKTKFSTKSYVLETSITDHYGTFFSIQFHHQTVKQKPIENKRSSINYTKLKTVLEQKDWEIINNITDLNQATNLLINNIKTAINTATETHTFTSKTKKLKPWMTSALLNSIRKRDKMKLNLKKQYSDELDSKFKTYRNNLKKLIEITRQNYYKEQVKEAGNNNKKVWQCINEATNNVSKKSSKILSIDDGNGEMIDDEQEIANVFNNFFTNIGKNIAAKIDNSYNFPLPSINYNPHTIFLNPVNKNEVIKYIHELNNSNSTGPDGISSKIIKLYHNIFIDHIVNIINNIFSTGVVPDHFKSAITIPIHKAESRLDCNNYRPISLTSSFSKIFEKCLKTRIVSFLDKYSLLSKKQFGFRQGLNTENAIVSLTDGIMSNFENGNKCCAVFIDLQKAFDTIPHSRLLEKLHMHGFRGVTYSILTNYLLNRTQITKINESLSTASPITIGLPQGTVLAPILFNIYLNDLLELPINGKITAFADDTVILFEGQNWEEVEHIANTEMMKIQSWLSKNQLTLNVKKTKYMTFFPTIVSQPKSQLHLELHSTNCNFFSNIKQCTCSLNKIIEPTSEFKYLGVVLDGNLRWKDHVQYLTKKLRSTIPMFYELRNILDKRGLKMVYAALIQSSINYAILAWGGAYPTNLKQLNITHRYVLKVISKRKRTYPSQLLYNECDVLPIHFDYVAACLKYFYTNTNNQPPINHRYDTRKHIGQELCFPKVSKQSNINYYKYTGRKYYNTLPLHIRKIESRRLFLRRSSEFVRTNKHRFADDTYEVGSL